MLGLVYVLLYRFSFIYILGRDAEVTLGPDPHEGHPAQGGPHPGGGRHLTDAIEGLLPVAMGAEATRQGLATNSITSSRFAFVMVKIYLA